MLVVLVFLASVIAVHLALNNSLASAPEIYVANTIIKVKNDDFMPTILATDLANLAVIIVRLAMEDSFFLAMAEVMRATNSLEKATIGDEQMVLAVLICTPFIFPAIYVIFLEHVKAITQVRVIDLAEVND